MAVAALGRGPEENGAAATERVIPASDLEVAVLDRTRTRPRKFLRLMPARLESLLGDRGPTTPASAPESLDQSDAEAQDGGSPEGASQ